MSIWYIYICMYVYVCVHDEIPWWACIGYAFTCVLCLAYRDMYGCKLSSSRLRPSTFMMRNSLHVWEQYPRLRTVFTFETSAHSQNIDACPCKYTHTYTAYTCLHKWHRYACITIGICTYVWSVRNLCICHAAIQDGRRAFPEQTREICSATQSAAVWDWEAANAWEREGYGCRVAGVNCLVRWFCVFVLKPTVERVRVRVRVGLRVRVSLIMGEREREIESHAFCIH